MNSFTFVVLAALVATAAAGIAHTAVVAPAPLLLAAGPAHYPHHSVAPLALPHPVSYASPAGLVLSPALLAATPVVKAVYAAPVVKAVHAAPIAYAAAPVLKSHHHHY